MTLTNEKLTEYKDPEQEGKKLQSVGSLLGFYELLSLSSLHDSFKEALLGW